MPTHGPPAYVKFRINKQVIPGNWILLGVIGTTSPNSTSYSDATCYGWAGHAGGKQTFLAGTNTPGHDGFTEFQQGDIVVLRLDTSSHTLKMYTNRLGRVFTISGLKDIPYWFHVNLYLANDQVEVLDVTAEDMALF